jgi:hypothetical protein
MSGVAAKGKLETGYYWVSQSEASEPEVARFKVFSKLITEDDDGGRWLFVGIEHWTRPSITPYLRVLSDRLTAPGMS